MAWSERENQRATGKGLRRYAPQTTPYGSDCASSAFVLIAFFVFGHACYKIGVGHARQTIEVEHIRQLELPTNDNPDVSPKIIEYEAPR